MCVHSPHDPIGAASARLLGAGIPRPERLFALRVLGLLLDLADRDGVVRVLPLTLAGEFDLDRSRVEAAFLHLRTIGVLVPAPAGWLIDGYEDYSPGEVNAGAALAMIADLLEGSAAEPAVAGVPRPAPPLAARAYPVLTVVMVVLLLLVAASGRSGDPQVALQVAGLEQDDIDDINGGAGEVETDDDAGRKAQGRHDGPRRTTPSTAAVDETVPDTAADPAPAERAADAPAAIVGPPTTSSVPGAPACPTGAPDLEVVEVTALPVPASGHIDASANAVPVGGPGWQVTVHGTVVNQSDAPLVVEAFDVVITTADGEQVVEALEEPMLVAAGATAPWQVTTATPLTAPPPEAEDTTAVMRVWRWAAACGS